MLAQGSAANETGNALEKFVINACKEVGVHVIRHSESQFNGDLFEPLILEMNVPYRSIYGVISRSEFVLRCDALNRRVRIECRWQETPGSVDEKLPFMLLNAIERMPEQEIILLVDGGGAREKAIEWLKTVITSQKYGGVQKDIQVMNMGEWQRWLRKFTSACQLAA